MNNRGPTYQTTPYAPSPTTSWISYCSDTLKEIFLELPLPGGGILAVVVGYRLGYWRFSVGRRELLLNSCVQRIGKVRRWKVESRCDSEDVRHSLRPLFVSTRTGRAKLWPLSAGHKLCLGSYPPGPGHLMVKRCSVMTVSSAPRAPLRCGTERDSRMRCQEQRAATSRCTATL